MELVGKKSPPRRQKEEISSSSEQEDLSEPGNEEASASQASRLSQ